MAQIAILAAIQIGLAVGSALLTPKPKLEKVDRGRQDDLRFTIVEEGAFIPRVYGQRVRLGANLFWSTPTQEYASSSGGSSGGKKGRGATPPTTTYSYDKDFAAFVCEGPIRAFLRIWEGEQLIFNQVASNISGYYEAEKSGNTLAGGATIVSDATLLSGRKVTLPPGASVTFNNVRANVAGNFIVGVYYQDDVDVPVTIRVNNTTDYPLTLGDSNNALLETDIGLTLLNSATNTIKITNNHATQSAHIDRIFVFPFFTDPDEITGIVDDGNPYPIDPNDPKGFYNRAARVNGQGTMTGFVSTAGQAQLEFFLGTEDQPQQTTIVEHEGAANTPAHRGLAGVAFKNYQLQNGQLQNLTFEVEPLIEDLADVLYAEYELRGRSHSQLNFEQLRGTIVEGLYIDRLAPLTEIVETLQLFYNFDIVPYDGKIHAKPRGQASVRTIPLAECLAYEEGSQRPAGIRIQHVEARDLPGGVYVAYVNPDDSTKNFHTGSQFVPLGFGPSLEAETINLPLVISNPNDVVAVGKRYLFGKHLEKEALGPFNLDPKHRDLVPSDVVTLQLEQRTIDVRLTSTQAALPGLVVAQALPEKAGLYNQVGIGEIGTGEEQRRVPFPANSFLWLGDIPTVRDADTGLITYAALCPRGTGNWPGAYCYEEKVAASGDYERLLDFPHAATIGVLVSSIPAVTDLISIDNTNSVVIDLYYDEDLFETRPTADIQARDVNMLVIGSGEFCEILKFATRTYSAGTSPYVRRVTLTGLLHARRGTQAGALNGHSAGAVAVLLTDSVKFFGDSVAKLNLARNFKGVTVGQALPDAPTTVLTSKGISLRPRTMSTSFNCSFTKPDGAGVLDWQQGDQLTLPLQAVYDLEITSSADTTFATPKRQELITPALLTSQSETPPLKIHPTAGFSTIPSGQISFVEPGGVRITMNTGDYDGGLRGWVISPDVSVANGLFLEFQMPERPNPYIYMTPTQVGIDPTDAPLGNGFITFGWRRLSNYGSAIFSIAPEDQASAFPMLPGDRFSILINPNGVVDYHINYLGPNSQPVYTSAKKVEFNKLHRINIIEWDPNFTGAGQASIVRARWVRQLAEYIYTEDAQRADFSLGPTDPLPAQLRARVRQRSEHPSGPPTAWVSGLFTR